jgi:hypothetical protein
MSVESRSLGTATLRVLAPPGQAYEHRSLAGLPRANPSGSFKSIQYR